MAWRDRDLVVKVKHVLLPVGNGIWDSYNYGTSGYE